MRRLTSYRHIAQELPEIGVLATTRRGEVGQVIALEDGQARLQFAGAVQGLYYPDEISWLKTGGQTEGHWQTEGAELHLADRDYPELTDILNKPAPAIVQEGNEWGRTASKTATHETKVAEPEPGKFVPHCLSTGCGWSAEPSTEEWANYHANEHRQQTLSSKTSGKTCSTCKGSGKYQSGNDRGEKCLDCNGQGYTSTGKSLDTKSAMEPGVYTKLIMALTEYDRKQEGKPGYNHYALPQYLGATQRAQELVDGGTSLRNALIKCFSGRLLSVALKAVGEPKGTDDEIKWGRTSSKTAAGTGPDGKRLTHEGPWNRAKNVHPDEYLAGRNAANSHSENLTALEGMKEAERHNGAFYGDGSTHERAHHAGQADSYAEKAMSKDPRVALSFGIGDHSFHPAEIGTIASRTADNSNPRGKTSSLDRCPSCGSPQVYPTTRDVGGAYDCPDCHKTWRPGGIFPSGVPNPHKDWYQAAKTADGSNPNNTDGFTETTFDPYGAFSAAPGDCETCFGEGAFSDLRPDGKGFGPEHDCPDCGGSGKAS